MGFFSRWFKPRVRLAGNGRDPSQLQQRRRLDLEQRFMEYERVATGPTCHFFRVRDRQSQQPYGLKVIAPKKIESFRGRYRDLKLPSEAELMAAVLHPGVVELFEFGQTKSGEPYLLLELMGGPRLDQLIQGQALPSLHQRLKIVKRMAEAIQAVHDAGLIHRDICPRNLICNDVKTIIKLFDFGLSVPNLPEFRQRAVRMGTPLYMAPEILRRRPISAQVDVFSFGVTSYHLLTGCHPWGVETNSSKSTLLFDTTEPRRISELLPQLHPRIAAAIHRCLDPDVERRFSSCKYFLAAAGDLAGDQAIQSQRKAE